MNPTACVRKTCRFMSCHCNGKRLKLKIQPIFHESRKMSGHMQQWIFNRTNKHSPCRAKQLETDLHQDVLQLCFVCTCLCIFCLCLHIPAFSEIRQMALNINTVTKFASRVQKLSLHHIYPAADRPNMLLTACSGKACFSFKRKVQFFSDKKKLYELYLYHTVAYVRCVLMSF